MADKTNNSIPKEAINKMLLALVPEDQPSPGGYIELVKSQVIGTDAKGNSRPNIDLLYFLQVCKRVNLDPLARQIYAVYRWDSRIGQEKMTIQTSIDGFRLIAQRSKFYGGQDDAAFEEKEGLDHPLKATVTVYRLNPMTGERMPITATARWNEYVQVGKDKKPMGLWGKMPYNQLGKCAEALALRKGFPHELSGIYAEEEMQQAGNGGLELATPKRFEKPEESQPETKQEEIKGEETKAQEPKTEQPKSSEETAKNLIEKRKQLKKQAEPEPENKGEEVIKSEEVPI